MDSTASVWIYISHQFHLFFLGPLVITFYSHIRMADYITNWRTYHLKRSTISRDRLGLTWELFNFAQSSNKNLPCPYVLLRTMYCSPFAQVEWLLCLPYKEIPHWFLHQQRYIQHRFCPPHALQFFSQLSHIQIELV